MPPGFYQIRLQVDGSTHEASFEVKGDPAVGASDEDLRAQYAFLVSVRDRLSETHRVIRQIRTLRQDLNDWRSRLTRQGVAAEVTTPLFADMERLKEGLDEIENRLVQTKAKSPKDLLNYPLRLNVKLASLLNRVGVAEARPTEQDRTLFEVLSSACETEFVRLRDLIKDEVEPLSQKLARIEVSPLTMEPVSPALSESPTGP